MPHILNQQSLKTYNTFGIQQIASHFCIATTIEEIKEAVFFAKKNYIRFDILGGGSNILLTKDYDGLLIKIETKGKEIIYENDEEIHLKIQAGENWHLLVMYCVQHHWYGIENMALIPGTVGAAPIQNIGAYGKEIKDVLLQVNALCIDTMQFHTFNNEECEFGYRDSFFKKNTKKYIILEVTLRLKKHSVLHTKYGDVQKIIETEMGGVYNIENVANAVIKIRKSKLPDPNLIGNAGSFFKNPVIEKSQYDILKKKYPHIPHFEVNDGIKIPAAWLIEQCNWKAFQEGEIGVHHLQALVLINLGNAKGIEILQLSEKIIQSVNEKFGIHLEREVNIW